MHDVYIEILIMTIKEQYVSEKAFYEGVLNLDEGQWAAWKNGQSNLSGEQSQKIKNLFSDYEWMLLQKILRQTIIFPEKRNGVVTEYRQMKTRIAQEWLKGELATVSVKQEDNHNAQLITLNVVVDYGQWGFDDILSFRLPAKIQQQIENEEVALLDWVNENLEETYLEDER